MCIRDRHKVVPRCVAMAYYPDGIPKRSVGVFYPDIGVVWTKDMIAERIEVSGVVAITDKQFTSTT